MSPRAPVPKSHQPRQRNGTYAGWYGRIGRRAEPQVPVERRGHGRRLLRAIDALRPVFVEQAVRRSIGPDVHFAHGADRAVPDHLAQPRGSARRPAPGCPSAWRLCASRAARVSCRASQTVVRERLLAIDVLARLHRRHRDAGVCSGPAWRSTTASMSFCSSSILR